MFDETAVHVIGGGIGGTVGAVLTCPLEVVKVRLQSSKGIVLSSSSFRPNLVPDYNRSHRFSRIRCMLYGLKQVDPKHVQKSSHKSVISSCISSSKPSVLNIPTTSSDFSNVKPHGLRRSLILRSLIDIFRYEGPTALFKGLVPTLVGVMPTRGIYFCAYHNGQLFFEKYFQPGSSFVYLCAAGIANTLYLKTINESHQKLSGLNLNRRMPGHTPITVSQVIRNTWKQDGLRGFYRGVSASYFGSLETALNFVVYENFKSELLWREHKRKRQLTLNSSVPISEQSVYSSNNDYLPQKASDFRGSRGGSKLSASKDMILCMVASACSKAIAITALYPHEVARTRLREETGQYRGFFRTLHLVGKEEGISGLYRGMATHYIRQVPNSCIMIGTYEFVVFLLQSWDLTKDTKV
uniref:Solute carrier family 25 member 36-A n=1 Tax=Schistosoma haematobium TaxID=6185 RepID=A0A094ZHN5_SCHHA